MSTIMTERYEGVVTSSLGDQIVVRYDVHGDIVEQTYNRDQFRNREFPLIGVRLAVEVRIVELPPAAPLELFDLSDDAPSGRTPLSGTVEF